MAKRVGRTAPGLAMHMCADPTTRRMLPFSTALATSVSDLGALIQAKGAY